jgi:hypothetical protein
MKSPDHQAGTEPIRMIVGMSRAGTTAMADALNCHPDVCCFGETRFFSLPQALKMRLSESDIEKLAEAMSKSFIALGSAMELRDLNDIHADNLACVVVRAIRQISYPISGIDLFAMMGEAVARHTGKTIWVEKTPHHLMYVHHILENRPDSKVIIMLRSPREFMRSYRNQGARKDPHIRKIHERLYNPILVSLVCLNYLKHANSIREKYPDSVKIINIDNVKSDGGSVLGCVSRHLDLPIYPLVLPKINSSAHGVSGFKELSPLELACMGTFVNPLAVQLGFEPIAERLSIPAFLSLLGSLCLWPIRNITTLKKLGPRLLPTLKRLIGRME